MRTLPILLVASSLAFGVPAALADDLVIAPEVGVRFHDDITVKHYKSHKWDGDVVVGTVLPGDIEYYDVPDEVVVATPALKRHRYVYLNDRVYIVDSNRRVIAEVRD